MLRRRNVTVLTLTPLPPAPACGSLFRKLGSALGQFGRDSARLGGALLVWWTIVHLVGIFQ
jgi:hypothetical protein